MQTYAREIYTDHDGNSTRLLRYRSQGRKKGEHFAPRNYLAPLIWEVKRVDFTL